MQAQPWRKARKCEVTPLLPQLAQTLFPPEVTGVDKSCAKQCEKAKSNHWRFFFGGTAVADQLFLMSVAVEQRC